MPQMMPAPPFKLKVHKKGAPIRPGKGEWTRPVYAALTTSFSCRDRIKGRTPVHTKSWTFYPIESGLPLKQTEYS